MIDPPMVATDGDRVGAPQAPVADRPWFRDRRDVARGAAIFVAVLVACIGAYLSFAVPGAWFPHAIEKRWDAKDLRVVRGSGRLVGDALVINAVDGNGFALVNVATDFRSSEYPGIEWLASGLDADSEVRILWRSDFQPDKLGEAVVRAEAGQATATVLAGNAGWIGHIGGLALAIHGKLTQPILIRGVIAKPMGIIGVVRDRLDEWFAFERWNGASINAIAGGEDYQRFPMPVLVALVIFLSAVVVIGIRHFRPDAFRASSAAIVAAFFLVGWLLLDARWTWNLIRQEHDTASRYAGKDWREKQLANDDGPLFAFTEKALAVLPRTPARIFIASDADYFRGRAAYHLYPHRVFFYPRSDELPPARDLRPGDWLLVYQRRGMQFDAKQGKVRWDGDQIVNAELKLAERGAALFLIR